MNLFNLAEKQLQKELDENKRENYKVSDVIDYAIAIRKYMDKHVQNGNLDRILLTSQEKRHLKYLETGK